MPEYNLIQNPELVRRLTALLGLRQAHIAPTLDENVTPVVLLADVQREPEFLPRRFSANGLCDGDNVTLGGGFRLENPSTSGIVAKVTRITVSLFTSVIAGGDKLFLDLVNTSTASFNLANVINTVRGKDWRKGIAIIAGTPASDQPSALQLLTGTASSNQPLVQFCRGMETYRTGNASANDAIAIIDLDTTDWGMYLQPGFTVLGATTDPVPAGNITVQWEERRQA